MPLNEDRKPPSRQKQVTPKRRLFALHSWFGFHLALIMSVVLFTGTIAVIADEIDWLLRDEMRVTPGEQKVSWSAMERAVRAAAPEDGLTVLWQGEADYFAYRAVMLTPTRTSYFLHVDPWTGAVTGRTHPLTVQRFFRDLHRYLFTPKIISLPIVCSMALVLLLSLYTGLKTAGRLKTVAFRVRIHRGARVFIGDFHRAAGIWSMWFLVLIATTGLWYLAEFGGQLAGTRFEPSRTGLSEERVKSFGTVIPSISSDEVVRRAKAAIPDWEPSAIFYPTRPQQPIMVWGRWLDPLVRDRANRVSLDPVDGSVVQIARSRESGVVAYLNDIADPLHFGDLGDSLLIKLLWFGFGLALTSLSFTGVWLTYKRLKSVSLSAAQLSTVPVLLLAVGFGTLYVQRYLDPGPQYQRLAEFVEASGPFSVRAVHSRIANSDKEVLRLHVRHDEGVANVRDAAVRLGNGATLALKPVFYGPSTVLEAPLQPGSTLALGPESLTIVDAAAKAHHLRLTVDPGSTIPTAVAPPAN
ncbi:MAG: PepSY-associated TM helix domain-containing protein [Pseudomonadota bacterium]